jgi:hypothetical protein
MTDYYTNDLTSAEARYTADQKTQRAVPNMIPQYAPQTQPAPITSKDMRQYSYSQGLFNIDWKDIIRRAIKYLVEGLAVSFVAYYFISKGRLNIKDIVLLGITAAFVFAILDTFSPTIALGTRFGAGFGIGQGLFGLNPTLIGGPATVTSLV